MIKLMLLLDVASEFDRRLIRGLVRYSRENGGWLFFRVPLPLQYESLDGKGAHIIDLARNWGANAIVGRWLCSDTSLLSSLGVPVVIQNYRERSREFSNLTGDYIGTGKIAAQYFRSAGLPHFAYFGVREVVWSEERKDGFVQELAAAGEVADCLMIEQTDLHERERIGRWLKELPKPVGLFCCDDAHALSISEICQAENVSIPGDISLLGVDNDELICGISDPEISSINLDVEHAGYLLGKRIHAQLQENSREPFSVVVKPGAITFRASTGVRSVSDPYVQKVIEFILVHFAEDITLEDVLSQVPLSRRSMELRFKKEMAPMTMHRFLLYCRVEHFARLLASTDRPIPELAMRSGLAGDSNISRTFRRFMSCSPQEYRQRVRNCP